MNAQGFLDLISKADNLENADLKKALKLQEKYPYFLAPKVLQEPPKLCFIGQP